MKGGSTSVYPCCSVCTSSMKLMSARLQPRADPHVHRESRARNLRRTIEIQNPSSPGPQIPMWPSAQNPSPPADPTRRTSTLSSADFTERYRLMRHIRNTRQHSLKLESAASTSFASSPIYRFISRERSCAACRIRAFFSEPRNLARHCILLGPQLLGSVIAARRFWSKLRKFIQRKG